STSSRARSSPCKRRGANQGLRREPAEIWEMRSPSQGFLLLYANPLAFAVAPSFLWAFARECPRIHRRTRLDDLARRWSRPARC
ncbi:MAG: hypothetical protein OXH69_15035, partial [Acidobacteria bacterium]|nr:hypothetical protein [Acidobacteriota bacterium]